DNPEKFAAGISGEIEQVVDEAWTTDWTEIEVTKRTGRLSITSSPSNAKIYIDEDFVSRTPATIDVRPGYRQVRLSLGADLRWTREVRVKSNQVKRLEAHLERVEYATLSITSDPSRAKIYVDGQYRGKTPRSISIEAKELTIELRKEGYSDWQRELRLFPRESREINADLPVEVVSKPNLDLDVSFGLGLNLGGFVDEPLSPGLELALNDLIVGTSVYGSGDPELPERINWEEEDFSGEKLDYGPEWEIYLGYPVEIYESLYLRAGAGLAIQPQAQLEQLETVSTTSTVKAITEVARDAQPVFEVNPTLHGGFHLERQGFSLQITYQSRRGPVIGFGYKF
ncbi:MAG: PEGA domain-containing protein, partial [Candidatus Acetothermia bacterium]